MSAELQLLVEWPSPWREFVSAIGPALRPSPPRLRHEARAGLFPGRGMLAALLLEAAALATAIAHPIEIVRTAESQPQLPAHDVIYFSANELPRTEDLAGAAAGMHGKSGGAAMRHRTQTIKVARGESLRQRVTDAPQLDLPKSDTQLSNLLAYRTVPGPPRAEALPLQRKAQQMQATVVLPRPEIRSAQVRSPDARLSALVVAPPPVSLPRHELERKSAPATLAVVAPPVSAPAQASSRRAQLTLPMEAVVAPPAEIKGISGLRAHHSSFGARVVPPPAQVQATRTRPQMGLSGTQAVAPPPAEIGTTPARGVHGLGKATVVPPAIDIAEAPLQHAMESANRGGPPPPIKNPKSGPALTISSAGKPSPTVENGGIIVSSKPGDRPAIPPTPEQASLAMSKSGSATLASGGEGTGRGANAGNGPGNWAPGAGRGLGASGSGGGVVHYARDTGTPYPGPGGAGDRISGAAPVPGVSVSGGNNVITLPSFGPPPPAINAEHSPAKGAPNAVTVVASPRAGGALNLYGALRGDRVYTIYINTRLGMAVMQFADPASAGHTYAGELTAPRAIRVDLPSDLSQSFRSPLLIRCQIDQTGSIKQPSVLSAHDTDVAQKVLAGVRFWKFNPAFRGEQAVAVDAILGFGVGTN